MIVIHPETTKNPITFIGYCAGVCWKADVSDNKKNYQRGIECIKAGHGRTEDFPNVVMIIDEVSAKVIREWYTHIGCLPARLQESTRYIDYDGFKYIIPPKIFNNSQAYTIYIQTMNAINEGYKALLDLNIAKEDASMVLPLGMTTMIIDKRDLRSLIDMSRQRMCNRAYWEYRELFNELCEKLSDYSDEWATLVKMCFHPKCEELGYCPEKKSCGRYKNERIEL